MSQDRSNRTPVLRIRTTAWPCVSSSAPAEMNPPTRNQNEAGKRRAGESGQARALVLVLVSFAMGMTVSALWFSRKAPPIRTAPETEAVSQKEMEPRREFASFAKPTEPASRPAPASPAPLSAPLSAPQVDPAALEAVKRAIPNAEAISLEKGALILRKAALADLELVVQEFKARQKQVEQNFTKGESRLSDERQKIATQQLKELQLEQMEKLKQIAANSKAQIEAFQQIKRPAP